VSRGRMWWVSTATWAEWDLWTSFRSASGELKPPTFLPPFEHFTVDAASQSE